MIPESIIGEFCDRKKLAPNAYVSSISDVIKVKRNQVRKLIDDLHTEQFNEYLQLAIVYRGQTTRVKKMQHQEAEEEIGRSFKAEDVQLKKKHQRLVPEK